MAHRRVVLSILLFGVTVLVFAGDLHYVGSADTRPAELLPVALLRDHSLTFDHLGAQTDGLPFDFVSINGHVVSVYPIVPGLVNVPVYLLADQSGVDLVTNSGRLSAVTAAIVAALSVVLMFVLLGNLFSGASTALLGASVYAFATCVWSVASKAMWQHGPSVLFIVGGLAALTNRRQAAKWRFVAGFLFGLATWNRPTNIVFLAAIIAWCTWQRRQPLPVFVLGAAIPLAAMVAYSWIYLGRVDTFGQLQSFDTFRGNPLVGLPGLLLSPSRGLLVFTPLFLLSGVGACLALRDPHKHALLVVLSAAVLAELLIYSKWFYWWGGASFGYRLIIDIVPALTVLAALGWHEWARFRASRIAAAALLASLSVYVQWLGATYYPCGFNFQPDHIDEHPGRLWDVADSELSRCTALWLGGERGQLTQI